MSDRAAKEVVILLVTTMIFFLELTPGKEKPTQSRRGLFPRNTATDKFLNVSRDD